MGFKTMKMGWDICSSPPWVPFYPHTMFQNPISWPSHKKCRKTIITQKVLVTQSSNIVHYLISIPKNLHVHIWKPLWTCFSLCKLMLFAAFMVRGSTGKQPKFHILLILTGQNASKWLEWCIFRVWGMPNPMLQVSSLCDKCHSWKITISGKNFTFCWFWLWEMHWNCLSGMHI